ncbi:hypothetical protein HU200_011124 [Digitaria exilis]|uniref:Reverse transcriptase zinc-binding domain-containing protein n=1 Tax=Digitaria exilis TaxID=1010633 RepID=A0A835FGD1_9POAL|nr:hypothetical protein HU200_011124 [Digitaria exilis]
MLKRRKERDSYYCVLSVEHVEKDIWHLCFDCPSSQACWIFLDIHWDTTLDFQAMILRARERFNSVIFREVIIIAMWAIWKHRNNIIFDGASLSFACWRKLFVESMKAVTLRAKPFVRDKINSWLSNPPPFFI